MSREFYNAHRGDGPAIDERVLGHTIGAPSSYPTVSERDALIKNGGLYSMTSAVGVGNGSITVGIQKSETEGQGTSFDFGVTVESEVSAGGVIMGANTKATIFEGTVGDIPAADYSSDKAYSFGLFSYPQTVDGQQLTVVNYWVE